jgi:hypothetical protein
MVVFLLAVGFVLLIVGPGARALFSPSTEPEQKKWAMSILSGSILSGSTLSGSTLSGSTLSGSILSGATGGLLGYLIRQ